MKSLFSSTFSFLTPTFFNTKHFCFSAHLCGPYNSFISNSRSLVQSPNFLSSSISKPLNSSYSSLESVRCYNSQPEVPRCSSSGEIHVIVGPMFAGKTTSLLRRIQAERSDGRFQEEDSGNSMLDKILSDLCFTGRLREAVGLLLRRGKAVQSWKTCSLLLQECIHRKQYELGKRIHAFMIVSGYDLNEYLMTKLLILYAKAGCIGTACIWFDKLQEKSLVSWNAMIAGYVQKGLEEEGLNLFNQMRRIGMVPDQFTFASVFRAFAALSLLEQGKQAHAVMIKCHVRQNVVVNSALMDMYFKCSSRSDAHLVFDTSPDRNTITWTALITGYGYNGKITEVLELFRKMIDEGFRPNYVTFLAVLCACSHGGLVDDGWKYFSSMKTDYGIQPGEKHYAAMVDLLGRAGRLEEAYELVQNSPFKSHPVIWGSLLGASRVHGDVDLGKISADKFFELDSENAGKYVVLANAYAAYGLWQNVAKIRGLMRDASMRKEPGYSRIAIQNEVHFFYMNDNTHKQAVKTNEMLRMLTCCLKDVAYIFDIGVE